MSRHLQDLETALDQLVLEHKRLLVFVEQHQQAMRAMDLNKMDELTRQQENVRLRIASIDVRRRLSVQAIAKMDKLGSEPTLTQLAELYPLHAARLLRQREELRTLAQTIAARSHVGSRLANALLGHLNTAVRIIAGAVEQAGTYTKQGVPRVSARIGVIEAVG